MTARDLITILQAMPQDLPICREDCEWGPMLIVRVADAAPGEGR